MNLALDVSIYLFVIVFIGYTIQTISGFGAIIFALPLSLFVVDRLEILPVFLIMSVFQSLAVAYKEREHLIKKEFAIMFVLAMIGMPVGILMGDLIPREIMNVLLGAFIIINSIYSIRMLKLGSDQHPSEMMKFHHRTYPFLSGFMQAAYGVGGPLIGTYMDKVTHDKKTYRGMISLYWCLLNPFIIFGYLTRGEINSSHFQMFLLLIPAVALGLFVGNRTIDRISKTKFQLLVHSMLIAIGVTLFF